MSLLLSPHLRSYYGCIHTVSWDAGILLSRLCDQLVLLISGEDPISKRMESALAGFLRANKINSLLVRVCVDDHPKAAEQLSAVMVPQLRLYANGKEYQRYRGTVEYDILLRLTTL